MSEERIPTTKRLADALRQAGAPAEMIARAQAGAYDDLKSQSATPILDLVNDYRRAGLNAIASRTSDGEFDAAPWESEEWAHSPEGQMLLLEFFGAPVPPQQGPAKMKFRRTKK